MFLLDEDLISESCYKNSRIYPKIIITNAAGIRNTNEVEFGRDDIILKKKKDNKKKKEENETTKERRKQSTELSFSASQSRAITLSNLRDLEVDFIVRDCHDHGLKLSMYPWSLIKDIKSELQKFPEYPPASLQRLYFENREVKNNRTLNDCGIIDGSELILSAHSINFTSNVLVNAFGTTKLDESSKNLIRSVTSGFTTGYTPSLAMDGTGGTYFLKDGNGRVCAVFKPHDEEPFAPNNPRGHTGDIGSRGFKQGVGSGGGAAREVAAYLLDRNSFSAVPPTVMVEISHPSASPFHYSHYKRSYKQHSDPKIGSLQTFVSCVELAGDFGPNMFNVEEVHKIGILDLRIVNMDRNDANLLVRRHLNGFLELIPIDHGYSLPSKLLIEWYDWVWCDWPQARKPFSQKFLDYIQSIDIDKDISILKEQLSISNESLRVFKVVNMLLKKGAKAGLCLADIADIVQRDNSVNSKLEFIMAQALALSERYQSFARKSGCLTINDQIDDELSDGNDNDEINPKCRSLPPISYMKKLGEQRDNNTELYHPTTNRYNINHILHHDNDNNNDNDNDNNNSNNNNNPDSNSNMSSNSSSRYVSRSNSEKRSKAVPMPKTLHKHRNYDYEIDQSTDISNTEYSDTFDDKSDFYDPCSFLEIENSNPIKSNEMSKSFPNSFRNRFFNRSISTFDLSEYVIPTVDGIRVQKKILDKRTSFNESKGLNSLEDWDIRFKKNSQKNDLNLKDHLFYDYVDKLIDNIVDYKLKKKKKSKMVDKRVERDKHHPPNNNNKEDEEEEEDDDRNLSFFGSRVRSSDLYDDVIFTYDITSD